MSNQAGGVLLLYLAIANVVIMATALLTKGWNNIFIPVILVILFCLLASGKCFSDYLTMKRSKA